MAATDDGVLSDWKKLWQLVSGIHYATPNETVKEKLMGVSKELQDGILQFKKCTTSSSDLEAFMKKKKQEKLFSFTNKLQQFLDIESEMCWELLCFYLVNEYRGSVHSLTNFISTESNMTKLLDDIWGYYSLERMIVLKVVKNLLEFYKVTGHPYNAQYKSVVESITLKKLRASYIEQLEYLIKENPPNKLAAGEFFNFQLKLMTWAERKARETIEILNILILIVQHGGIEPNEVKKLLECFKMHAFGREQRYFEASNDYHKELVTKITYCEVILFLKCIDQYGSPNPSWIQDVTKLLDKQIVQLHHNPEHGPLLLGWMLLNFHILSQDDDDALNKYRQFGSKAVQLGVFGYLFELLTHQMFKDESLVSRISRRTIYNFLSHLCDLFDGDGSVARHSNVYDLLCELISWTSIAADFHRTEDSGCRSLLNTAMERFPADFIPLSMIASGLSSVKISENKWVQTLLEELPICTEIYDSNKYSLKSSQDVDDEYVLQNDYVPFRRVDYKIPAGTTAILTDELHGTYIHFRHPLNYFDALHNEINVLFAEALQFSEFSGPRLARVNSGIKYLSLAIQKIKTPTDISAEMVHPTEMVIDLLDRLKILQNPPIELLANCLNVCAALLPLFDKEISMRVINLNILPCMKSDNLDYKKYAHGVGFDSSLVGFFLVNFEKNIEKYDFLSAYLNFLVNYTKLYKNNLFAVEIPGLIFLLREVFPHIHSWRFQESSSKNILYKQVLQYLFDILQMTKDQLDENEDRRLLRDICVYSMLNFENGIILLKFVAIGNPYLQSVMENETNWMSSPFCPNHLVQLSMTILMQLLRLKTTIFDGSTLSPLESLIYTQPKQRDTLRIIPVVTSYMSNIFNRSLPILSCRLLRRIAIEFKMSLLACLDMEPDQIRLTFLQKLPEELESDNLKIAVLEFVEACIERQPGLTEAFFKINYDKEKSFLIKEKKTPNIGDSILTYMKEFLEAILKNPKTVESPLLSRILALFHALWKNNMQTLVKELMEKPTFWKSLCNPLLSNINGYAKAYSQLLNILGIEIFCCSTTNKINPELKKVLEQFLDPNHFETWIKQIFELPKEQYDAHVEDETPDWLCKLQSFKDFVVILLRKKTIGVEFPTKSLKVLAYNCLNALVDRAGYTEDFRPFIVLSELFLVLSLNFKHKYTDSGREDREVLDNIVELLSTISSNYENIHPRAKESCLSIAIKTVSFMPKEWANDSSLSLRFLQPIIDMVSLELDILENQLKGDTKTQLDDKRAEEVTVLSLSLLKNTSVIFSREGPANWDAPLKAAKIFPRLLACTSMVLQNSRKHKLSVELLDVLIVFAKSNCSDEFLYCDIGDYLWLKLLPPKELVQVSYVFQPAKENAWTCQNWWPIYSRGIDLVTTLFRKHHYRLLKEVLIFVGVHEEYLVDSILLAKQSLEPNAMILVKNAALLASELVAYEKEWRLEHSQSMFNLVRGIQTLMDHSISLLYRPKILRRLIDGQNQPDPAVESTNDPSDVVVEAMNDLIEIIIISSKCLLRISPQLLNLIAEPEFLPTKWFPLIEIQFGAPKLDAGSCPLLTFGTVLSAVSLFTKALNLQNYTFHEEALNSLEVEEKSNGSKGGSNTGAHKNGSGSPTSRQSFLKSVSVTSVTSLVSSGAAQTYEFLSLLDSALCLSSLEHVLTFLASQTLLALKNTDLSNREKQLIRREISTELMTYHEFVRKKVLNDYRGNPWQRKKHGIVLMMDVSTDSGILPTKPSTSSLKSADLKQSMRVNVVRRQHLQHIHQQQHKQQTPSETSGRKPSFEMSRVISPITSSTTQSKSNLNAAIESSTPSLDRNGKRIAPAEKDFVKKICVEDEEEIFFEPEESTYSPLSYVKLVEEDYLHFLSNLFMVICQSD